jgi:hypothetical protein
VKRIVRGPATPALHAALQESLEANIALLARPEVRDRVLAVMERFTPADGSHA